MSFDRIRFARQAKDQLIKLKRNTGLQNWNTICRWAFCISLADPTAPSPINITTDSTLEMEWKTFAGSHQEIYLALLKQRCVTDGFGTDADALATQLRLHLHRGIGQLAANKQLDSIGALLRFAN
ncbi:MAG TPA: DNA sulfur modification protein DndE [Pyrinomonadaceae bacterium]|nr:DNA sulfur modification protein DndE [Pyrinomonadaceae bacterium]